VVRSSRRPVPMSGATRATTSPSAAVSTMSCACGHRGVSTGSGAGSPRWQRRAVPCRPPLQRAAPQGRHAAAPWGSGPRTACCWPPAPAACCGLRRASGGSSGPAVAPAAVPCHAAHTTPTPGAPAPPWQQPSGEQRCRP
jgi:hypothetical protein